MNNSGSLENIVCIEFHKSQLLGGMACWHADRRTTPLAGGLGVIILDLSNSQGKLSTSVYMRTTEDFQRVFTELLQVVFLLILPLVCKTEFYVKKAMKNI